jgi:ABC-type uncharacterized transport system permease subunit
MALSQKLKSYRSANEETNTEDQLKSVRQMSLADLEKEVIQFGKAKCGQTFRTAFEDGRWTDWFVTTYESSTKIEHAKYITYVSKRLDAEIAADTKKYKNEGLSKKGSLPTTSKTSPKEEPGWEEASELSEFVPIMETSQSALLEEQVSIVQEENHNLRGRMTQIEMAIQELITHVKALTPSQ